MFDLKMVPPSLMEEAFALNQQEARFLERILAIHQTCSHGWKKVMGFDRAYQPRSGATGVGENIIVEYQCPLCNLRRPFSEDPWDVCHKCGGKMKNAGQVNDGGIRVHIHKCPDCGHEYETT